MIFMNIMGNWKLFLFEVFLPGYAGGDPSAKVPGQREPTGERVRRIGAHRNAYRVAHTRFLCSETAVICAKLDDIGSVTCLNVTLKTA